MKKLARLTALFLTGALLLVLTACGAETEQQAKQRLLDEINSYRASIHLDQLEEVKQLSDAEQELIEHFRAAGKTVLPKSEADEALDDWGSATEGWSYYDDFGLELSTGGEWRGNQVSVCQGSSQHPGGQGRVVGSIERLW